MAYSPALDSRLQAIRRTTVAFSSLFKDITFIRYSESGYEEEKFKVPIVYSNKEKYIKRLDGDPGLINQQVQISLPRIEYGLLGIQYDPSRRTNQANKIAGCGASGSQYVNSPAPYNFNFELVIYTRNIEDANQILEYILPYFYPDYNLKVNMVPALNIVKSVPFTFNGESEEEDSTGSYDSPVRSVFRTLSFTARSFIYQQSPKTYIPILQAETNIYNNPTIRSFYLTANTGKFNIGDIIYQGDSFNMPDATAIVVNYNFNKQTIGFTARTGSMLGNTAIRNVLNTANAVLSIANNSLLISSIITPTPNTYPVIGPYNYNVKITDYTA